MSKYSKVLLTEVVDEKIIEIVDEEALYIDEVSASAVGTFGTEFSISFKSGQVLSVSTPDNFSTYEMAVADHHGDIVLGFFSEYWDEGIALDPTDTGIRVNQTVDQVVEVIERMASVCQPDW